MPPRIVRISGLFLLYLGLLGSLSAQNCGQRDTVVFAANSTAQIQHITSDYFNNNLADPMQGLCGVEVGFVHQYVENFELRITSPAGQSVTLIGPNGSSTFDFTPGTRWNISFVPCAATARPDSAFASRWNNDQAENWRPFGRYTGSYYPFMGCLETFNTGPVNGTWTFSVINNPSSNPGAITYIRLIFCDSRGVECCFTQAGEWRNPPLVACTGADTLLLQPDLVFPNGRADTSEYDYAYLLAREGIFQELRTTPDLRDLPPGRYELCGLSYRRSDRDSLPAPDGLWTVDSLRSNLEGLTPLACAQLTPTCWPISIFAPPDTTFLNERICRGDSVVIGGTAYRDGGIFVETLSSFAGCDSVVHLNLFVQDVPVTTIDTVLCAGESTAVGSMLYATTGLYRDTLATAELGCDSIVVLNLVVLSELVTTLNPVICQGETFMIGDSSWSNSGIYQVVLANALGCDSLIMVNLTVLSPTARIMGDTLLNCARPVLSLDGNASTPLSNLSFTWLDEGGTPLGNLPIQLISGQGLYILLASQTMDGVTCTSRDTIRMTANFNTPTADPGTPLSITCMRTSVEVGGALTSTGGPYHYTWTTTNGAFTGETTAPTATVTRPGDYALLVRDTVSFCEAMTTVTVLMDTLPPNVLAGSGATLNCANQRVVLDGSPSVQPGVTATWSGPCIVGVLADGIAEADCAGTYFLTVTNTVNGCVAADSVVVDADFALPVAVVEPPDTLTCVRTNVVLDARNASPQGLLNFEWSIPAQAAQPGLANIEAPGDVRLIVERTDNFCRDTLVVTVVQDTLAPVADAGVDVVLNCYSAARTVGGSNTSQGAVYTYQWWEGDDPIPGATADTLVVTRANRFRLFVTDLRNGCTSSDEVSSSEDFLTPEQVNAGLSPLLNCANELVQLLPDSTRFSQPVSWQWSGPCVDSEPGVWALSTNCPGWYVLTVTNIGNGCVGRDSTEVGVSQTFSQARLAPNATLSCETGTAILDNTGTIGTIFNWQRDGQGISLPNSQPTVNLPGVYTLIVSDFEQICVDTAQVTVAWDCTPQIVLLPTDTLTCSRQSVILAVDENLLVGAHEYTWTGPAADCFVGDPAAPQVEVVCGGEYQIIVQHTLSGQRDTALITVAIDTLPPVIDAGMNQQITCTDTVATLSATVVGDLVDYRFTWTNFNEDILAQSPTFTTSDGGTYFLVVENLRNGCINTDATQVTISSSPPTIGFGSLVFPCMDDTLRLRAFVSPTAGDYRYGWSGPGILADADSLAALVNAVGEYTFTVENISNGCLATATVSVTEQDCVPCLALSPVDTLNCIQTEVVLDVAFCAPCDGCTLQWSDENGNIPGENDLQLRVGVGGTYTLTATDIFGFQSTVTAQVLQFDTPPELNLGDDRNLTCDRTAVQLDNLSDSPANGLTYQWQRLEDALLLGTDTVLVVHERGTYMLTLSDAMSGCMARDTVVVGIDTLPAVAEAGMDRLLTCTVNAVALDGAGSTLSGATYAWTGPAANCLAGANSLNPLATCEGLYTLRVTRANGCFAQDTVRVTIDDERPQLTPLSDTLLTCTTTNIALIATAPTGGGDFDYRWCPVNAMGEDISNLCSFGLERVVATAGRYRFTATNVLTNCSSNYMVQVGVDTLAPVLDAGSLDTLPCNTAQRALNATAEVGTYRWWDALGNPLQDGTTLTPTIFAPGWYFLEVTAADNGCTAVDSVRIINDVRTPVLFAGADTLIDCLRPTVVLSASGNTDGNAQRWQWTTADGNIVAGADTPQPMLDAAGTYAVALTDLVTGCLARDTLQVLSDFRLPQAVVAQVDSLVLDCRRDTLLLDGTSSAGSTGQPLAWTWNAVGTGQLFPTTNMSQTFTDRPGNYRLIVQDTGNGCRDTVVFSVGIDRQAVQPMLENPAVLSCQNTSVVLQPQTPTSTTGLLFRWRDSGSQLLGETFTQTVTAPGWYFLDVENLRNGCLATDSVQVSSIADRPAVRIAPPLSITCERTEVALDGSASAQGVTFQYQWTTPNGLLIGNTQSPTATAATEGDYMLTVLNTLNGCDSSATVSVVRAGAFISGVALDVEPPNCTGNQIGSIGIDSVQGGTPPYQYSLDGGAFSINSFFEALPIGSYTIRIRDAQGCTWLEMADITPPELLTIDLGQDTTLQLGDSLTLLPMPSRPVLTWRWIAPQLLAAQAPFAPTVTPLESQFVILTVTDNRGCTASDTLRITVGKFRRLFLPTAFSPNGDGNNDRFTVYADQEVVTVNHLRIFNRWGGQVFERLDFPPNDPALGWDGTLDGQPLNTGVFVYSLSVTYRDGRVERLTGDLVLMR